MSTGKVRYKRWTVSNALLIVVCTSLLLILLSTILYQRYTEILTNQIYRTESEALNTIQTEYDNINAQLASIVYLLGNNEQVNTFFRQSQNTTQYEITMFTRMLQRQVSMAPYVESIYLLDTGGRSIFFSPQNFRPAVLFNNEHLADQQIFEVMTDYERYRYHLPLVRTTQVAQEILGESQEKTLMTYIYSPQPPSVKQVRYAIVVNVSVGWMEQRLAELSPSGVSFIVSEGRIVCSGNTTLFPLMQPASEVVADFEAISALQEPRGFYVGEMFGEKTIFIYRQDAAHSRHFITAISYDQVLGQLGGLTRGIMLICAVVLASGIIASLLVAFKVNAPIRRLYQLNQTLQKNGDMHTALLRQEVLRRVIGGELPPGDIPGEVDFTVDLHALGALMMFEFMGESWVPDHLATGEESLIETGAQACIGELLAGVPHEVCAMSWHRYVVLLEGSRDAARPETHLKAEEIRRELAALMKADTAAVVLQLEPGQHLPDGYRAARRMLRYTLYFGVDAVIGPAEMAHIHTLDYGKFTRKWQKLQTAMGDLSVSECRRLFKEILDLLRYVRYEDFTASVLHMSVEVATVLWEFQKSPAYDFPDVQYDQYVAVINRAESLDQLEQAFGTLFGVLGRVRPRSDSKNYQRALDVKQYIDTHYADSDLNAATLAERYGVSSSYLGKVFSDYIRQTIPGYIAEVRIRHSQELLKDPSEPIGAIAETVGFSSSKYFYKVFRDITGTTPNSWRQKYREENHV